MSNILDTVKNASVETSRAKGRPMPSTSPAQARLMAAAAHTPGGFGGVPQSVGRDFNQADKGSSMLKAAMHSRNQRQNMQKDMKPMKGK